MSVERIKSNLPPLLGPGDPPPVAEINPDGRARVVLCCDHASRAVPIALGDLGVSEAAMERHVAYDVGAAEVTLRLSAALDAPAVFSGFSRLVMDLNRRLGDPTSIPPVSDGVEVPANVDLSAEEMRRRADALFWPYHDALAARIAKFRDAGIAPALISIHSFTPTMRGFERPWHVGVLWNRDPRIPVPLMEKLARDPEIVVGDNEPYSGRDQHGYTVDTHAADQGLPHVLIEIRQDLIATERGQAEWAARLAEPLADILADDDIFRAERY